jgi:hypothetical protein
MEKKSCKFSITQFEFELEADNEIDSDTDKQKWENSEIEYLKKYQDTQIKNDLSKAIKLEPEPELESEPKQEPALEPIPILEKKQKKTRELKQEKLDRPQKLKREKPKRKIGESWLKNLELYQKGEKKPEIYTWISHNKSQYKAGRLLEEKLEKLIEIKFPFDAPTKKRKDKWHKQLELWKKGDRSDSQHQWRQSSVKQYIEGKLTNDRIEKLKEVGILK